MFSLKNCTIVNHLDEIGAVIAQTHLDLRGIGVNCIFNQFFHCCCQIKHHLTRANAMHRLAVNALNLAH